MVLQYSSFLSDDKLCDIASTFKKQTKNVFHFEALYKEFL